MRVLCGGEALPSDLAALLFERTGQVWNVSGPTETTIWSTVHRVDEISLELVRGGQLDYVEELIGSYFAVVNPNASSSCGCGTSFSI